MKKQRQRYIENTFDYKSLNIEDSIKQIKEVINLTEKNAKENYPPTCQYRVDSTGKKKVDTSFYTGTGGFIYLYWRQFLYYKDKNSFKNFQDSVATNLNLIGKKPSKDCNSFFQGDSGIYVFACLLHMYNKDAANFEKYFSKLINLRSITDSGDCECEILYGSAGYLYSLLFLKKYSDNFLSKEQTALLDKTIIDIFNNVLKTGMDYMKAYKWQKCLLYPFPSSREDPSFYLGAAHGLIGNLYLLLATCFYYPQLLNDKNVSSVLLQNLKYIESIQLKTGNFPSHVEADDSGSTVHFCHGCVGATHLFFLGHKLFPQEKSFLTVISNCLKCLWERGLLLKGNGVCHGMSGITYSLMKIYKESKDKEVLKRALCMCMATFNKEIKEICSKYKDPQRLVVGVPDRPYSLMEGEAGDLCLYYDIFSFLEEEKEGDRIIFPGYEIV